MTKKEVLSIVIKVFGLYLFVMAIQILPTVALSFGNLSHFMGLQGAWYFVINVIPFLLMVAIAFYFIINTPRVLRWVGDEESNDEKDQSQTRPGMGKEAWQEVIFSGLGVFFAVSALPRLVTNLLVRGQQNMGNYVAGPIVQLILGLGLFFGAKKLANLVKKF